MSQARIPPAGMPCPRCGLKCRGVWLGRGELDKIIEHSQQQLAARTTGAICAHAGAKSLGRAECSGHLDTPRRLLTRPGDRGYDPGYYSGQQGGDGRHKSFFSRLFDD
jgi:Zn-finger nucleic acid-binding protein